MVTAGCTVCSAARFAVDGSDSTTHFKIAYMKRI